ncbi:hypothetical protein SEA_NIKE_95 [Microbacterium phage Nike]|nr:hypothetical protein SEA_NIKE_95 [Microbacterium phage Nike]
MSATVEIGYDVRHWVTFEIKDATPEEIEILENDDEESIELAAAMWKARRLTEVDEHEEDGANYFNTESSSIIEVTADGSGE